MVDTDGSEKEKRSGAGDGSPAEQKTIGGPPEGNRFKSSKGKVGRQIGSGSVYFIENHDGAFVKIGYTIEIESGGYGYTWVEDLGKSKTYLVLPAGEDVAFYRYKDWFVIPDARNKKHYFRLAAQRVLHR